MPDNVAVMRFTHFQFFKLLYLQSTILVTCLIYDTGYCYLDN